MLNLTTEQFNLQYHEVPGDKEGYSQVQLIEQNGSTWQRTLSGPASTTPNLLFSRNYGQAYVVYGLDIFSLDIHTGDTLWQYHVDEPVWATYLIKGKDLLLHLELSIIYLNDAGHRQWHFDHNEIITEVSVQNSALRSSSTGTSLWQMLFSRQRLTVQDMEERVFILDLASGVLV